MEPIWKVLRTRFTNYPLKTNLMQFLRTRPLMAVVIAAFFIQFPFLMAGSHDNERKALPTYVKSNTADAGAVNEETLLMHAADSIYRELGLDDKGLEHEAFLLAYKGYQKLLDMGVIARKGLLSIVDFSKPSTEKRFYVIDMESGKTLFHSLVAHGRNSGLKYATDFSNQPSSYKSSLGFYLTLQPYYGGKGYALRLKGLEKGINDKAYERAIVIHGSDYVDPRVAAHQGYLGRSHGCPALPRQLNQPVINTIKDGSVLFIYHPSPEYVAQSEILNG